jgi:hypothetical protein
MERTSLRSFSLEKKLVRIIDYRCEDEKSRSFTVDLLIAHRLTSSTPTFPSRNFTNQKSSLKAPTGVTAGPSKEATAALSIATPLTVAKQKGNGSSVPMVDANRFPGALSPASSPPCSTSTTSGW